MVAGSAVYIYIYIIIIIIYIHFYLTQAKCSGMNIRMTFINTLEA